MYYTLEKAAEVLSITTGDLNRLREGGKLRAFRDGSDWKFRKEDIDNYLAQQIKTRSADEANDLLSDTDEETPTLLADSTAFEGLAGMASGGLKISTNDNDEVVLDETPDLVQTDGSDSGISLLDEVPEQTSSSSDSGISLLDEEPDHTASSSDSGISLLDDGFFDAGGSNVDLGQDDIILGDASGSGLNLDGGSGIMLGSLSSGGSDSGISLLNDDNLFSLAPGPASEEPAVEESAEAATVLSSAEQSDSASKETAEPDIFGLAEEPEQKPASKIDLGKKPQQEKEPVIETIPEDEDFQLAPVEADEDEGSDSESSSKIIPLEDEENLFMTEDSEEQQVYGLTEENAQAPADNTPADNTPADNTPAAPAALDSDFGTGAGTPFDNNFDSPGDFGSMGDFGSGGDFGSAGDFGTEGFDNPPDFGAGFGAPADEGQGLPPEAGTPDFSEAAGGAGPIPMSDPMGMGSEDLPIVGGCSYAAGKGCRQEQPYSNLAIWLGLIPCILILLLAGIGAFELVRTIWSWDQPFSLTGPVLETIGGLINLI